MRLNAIRELDKMLLEIALADGTSVQRSLIGIVGLVFIQPRTGLSLCKQSFLT